MFLIIHIYNDIKIKLSKWKLIFDSDILYLIKQKEFHPYEYISSFGKFKERLPRKESFYSLLTDKRISDNHYKNVLKVWDRFEMTAMKDYYD